MSARTELTHPGYGYGKTWTTLHTRLPCLWRRRRESGQDTKANGAILQGVVYSQNHPSAPVFYVADGSGIARGVGAVRLRRYRRMMVGPGWRGSRWVAPLPHAIISLLGATNRLHPAPLPVPSRRSRPASVASYVLLASADDDA